MGRISDAVRLWQARLLILVAAGALITTAHGQTRPAASARPPEPTAPVELPPPPYEPLIIRLAEILGALTYMGELCRPDGPPQPDGLDGASWRRRMTDLIEAEAHTASQKERFAGAFNRGFVGYGQNYRTCTPGGQEAVRGLLRSGAQLTQDLTNRYGL